MCGCVLTKVCLFKAMVFPVVMYGCENWTKESWALKNWCFGTVVLEKTLESPLDCKEIQPVHLKGDQSWVFIGRTDAEAETPILWPSDVKNWLTGKDPDAGKDWGQEEKGTTEDEMGWMPSPTSWTWVWANSRRWWWTGKPGMLQSMESQSRTWLSNWAELNLGVELLAHMAVLSFPGGSVVKNPPAVQETQAQPLSREGALEKGMVTHSSILSWRSPMDGGAPWT